MGLFGPPNVEAMKTRKNVLGLIKALGYWKDLFVQKAAAEALGKIGDPLAVEPLIAVLKDNLNGIMLEAAAKALGKIGDPRAVEPLIAALSGRWVREAAAREAAAKALDKIGWLPDEGSIGAAYWVAKQEWDRCVKIGAPAVEPLIAVLEDEERGVPEASAKALGQIGDPLAVGPLIVALKNKYYSDVREASAKALGQIGDPRAVGPLTNALKDKERGVREAAAEAIDKIGAPAVESLTNALKDKHEYVRKVAAEALDKIGWLPDEGSIGAAYWVAKQEWDRCVKIGAPAVEPLIAVLKDKERGVRKAAAEALVGFYQAGRLDSIDQQIILSKRAMITRKHVDYDYVSNDCSNHEDKGIGVSFPV